MYSVNLPLLVALLVVLAGCTGGGAGTGDGTDAGPGETATPVATADTEFAVGDAGQLLREAGSFSVTWTYVGTTGGVEQRLTNEFTADVDNGRSLTRIFSATDGIDDDQVTEQFVADGVTYLRSGSTDAASYTSFEGGERDVVASAIALSQARTYGADDGLTFVGSEVFDGVRVDRYELSAADAGLALAGAAAVGGASGATTITDFQYVVLVDADGLSRYESWTVSGRENGEAIGGSWEYSLTGVGSTSVADPAWLGEATAA
jgi:hypothetical protein